MVKVLSFRFQQCFGPFSLWLVEESSETRFSGHLFNDIFRSPWVRKNIRYEGYIFWKVLKIESIFRKLKRKLETIFRFCDNCIWKCCDKLSLLKREYLLSDVNGLRNSPGILHIIRETFWTGIAFAGINKYGKGAVVQLWTVFWPVYHVTYRRVLLKLTVLDLYVTTFFGVRQFKNTFKL